MISVIVPNYNGGNLIKKCLYSIFNSTEDTSLEVEVIVIDNASTDGSAELISEEFPKVKLILNRKNLGFARALNQGLRLNGGEYKLILNSDALINKDALFAMEEFLKKNPEVGAVGPEVIGPDGHIQPQGGTGKGVHLHRPVKVRWLSGRCIMLRRKVIEDTGFFDEGFFFYNEDLDYSRRMRKEGWELYYLPQARIIHYEKGSSRQIRGKLIMEGYKSGLYYCRKHYFYLLPFYKILMCVEIVARIIINLRKKETLPVYLRALRLPFKRYNG